MPKVNREHVFNIQFVGYVSKHSCLYNTDLPEYRSKDLQDSAWRSVSEKCGEPEETCRKRWRNLKTSTARYLKQLRMNKDDVKPYYLYQHMKFAIPFLKSKDDINPNTSKSVTQAHQENTIPKTYKIKGPAIKEDETSEDESYQYEIIESDCGYIVTRPADDPEDHEDGHIDESESQQSVQCEQPSIKRQKVTIEPRSMAGNCSMNEVQEDIPIVCPDELFLKSLLPDINMMTNDQKRKFKIGVLNLVDKILCP